MHISDGVLSLPVAGVAAVVGVGIIAYAAKDIKSEEIPKISLLTAAFFVASLIRIPIGPSSMHLVLIGLLGVMLGRRAPLAILVGLIMQAALFQHGGMVALGMNFVMMSIPALIVGALYQKFHRLSIFLRGATMGGLAILIALIFLIGALLISDSMFNEGSFSVINVLLLWYIPLIFIEGLITGIVVRFIHQIRPQLIG